MLELNSKDNWKRVILECIYDYHQPFNMYKLLGTDKEDGDCR